MQRIHSSEARMFLAQFLSRREKLQMNLFDLILEKEDALCWSDGGSVLAAQSNERTPLWLWLREELPSDAMEQAAAWLAEELQARPGLCFSADPNRCGGMIERVERLTGGCVRTDMRMNAYALLECPEWKETACRGRMVAPAEGHQAAMASLLRQMTEDAEGQVIPESAAREFAQAMTGSNRLFLWEDDGVICAMAMIAHEGPNAARINTVVTDRACRGQGYAGMLVSQICRKLMERGVTPMLYADAAYLASNRVYQKIGFEKIGEISNFSWKTAE